MGATYFIVITVVLAVTILLGIAIAQHNDDL
jgi:hypothetical protein